MKNELKKGDLVYIPASTNYYVETVYRGCTLEPSYGILLGESDDKHEKKVYVTSLQLTVEIAKANIYQLQRREEDEISRSSPKSESQVR